MLEDIVKIQDFNNASTVENRRGNNPDIAKKKVEKAVDTAEANKPENKDVKEAMVAIVNVAKFFNRKIRLEVDADLNIMVVKVIDGETDQVIRQIPAEEIVRLSKHAKDQKGLLINREG